MLRLKVKIGNGKFAGWEEWLDPVASKGSTSKVYFWLPKTLSLADQRRPATLSNLRICGRELSLRYGRVRTAKLVLTIILAAMALSGCGVGAGADHSPRTTAHTSGASPLSQEEKHRLYTAALAASDAPLDTALFKDVCKKIGIFDPDGNPNGSYMAFVQEHVQWGMKTETNQFRLKVNTKERAQDYVLKHLP